MQVGTVASELLLHRCSINRPNRVVTALNILKTRLFKYQGHIGAALILGGVDKAGAHLHSIYPHGSSDSLPYASMGSGSLAAMAMLENEYRDGLSLEDAKGLICRAIHAGILNDLGSGSNVDLCVITRDGVQQLRNYQMFNHRTHIRDGDFLDSHIPDINTSNLRTATLCNLP
jgi:20S proteasome subunit beta 2